MNWHDKNKSKTTIDIEKLSGSGYTHIGDIGGQVEAAIEKDGGTLNAHANALTEAWVNTGKAFSPHAMHISAIKIAREVTDHLIEKEAPAAALFVLALSFREAAARLIKRAEEIDPNLSKEIAALELDK